MANSWFKIVAKKDAPAEVSIYDEIGFWGISAKAFIDQIRGLGDINLTVHSPGGEVADGLAIYNALRSHKGRVTAKVDTLAASMASVIALAADEVQIADNGFFMIHDPWMIAAGNADEMEKMAQDMRKFEDVLVNTYVERTGQSEDEVRTMMKAETWLNAQESLDKGFASSVYTATKAAASIKDFATDLPKKFTWPNALTRRPAQPSNKEKSNMEDKDKLLELQAKLSETEAALKAEKIKSESLDEEVKAARAETVAIRAEVEKDAAKRASEALELVEAHKAKIDDPFAFAREVVALSANEIKDKLLELYAKANQPAAPAGSGEATDITTLRASLAAETDPVKRNVIAKQINKLRFKEDK